MTALIERPELSDSFFRRSSSSGSLAKLRISFGLRGLVDFVVKSCFELFTFHRVCRETVLHK